MTSRIKIVINIILTLTLIILFFSGCGHKHNWEEATCTTPRTCTICNKTEGDPLGHKWKGATCTEINVCERCGEAAGDPLGHSWVENEIVEPSCTSQGYTMYVCERCGETQKQDIKEALGHQWLEATCYEPKTCSVCGETSGEPLGHDTPELSCTKSAECTRCGEEIPAPGHDWQDAPCTEPRTCNRCGEKESEAVGHIESKAVKENEVKPSCTEDGHYDEVIYCSVCNEELSRKTITEPALGHQVKDGVCSRCGEEIKVTLYEDSSVKITFKNAEVDSRHSDELEVYFYVENKTEETILIQADAVSINGYCFCDVIISDPVSPKSIGIVNISVQNFDGALANISQIESIGAQFRIIDDDTWDSYKAMFSNVQIDGSGIGSVPKGFVASNILYEDDESIICFKTLEKAKYNDDEAELYLYFINKTDRTLLIQADTISINKFSFSNVIMSDPVLPDTVGTINPSIYDFDFESVDIEKIECIGGQLRIIDDASWNSRTVSFTNVEVK